VVITLDNGTEVATDVLILGAGRRPRTAELNLSGVGVAVDQNGAVPIDERCRVRQGLWALGDVTGIALFTHVAKYQGRVVADNILGRERVASYAGIPRVVFADPEIAAVGLTADRARQSGMGIATAEIRVPDSVSRSWTYERDPRGSMGVVADRTRRVLVGAWAVAPLASEWIHQAALAIRAEIPLDVLLDQVAQYPTYSEAYLSALERLS
jgi:dihydrolipoamide dehydrogenase